jgi:hypothetical protein
MWGCRRAESKSESKGGDHLGGRYYKGGPRDDAKQEAVPQIEVCDIVIVGENAEVSAPLELKIKFDLDRGLGFDRRALGRQVASRLLRQEAHHDSGRDGSGRLL